MSIIKQSTLNEINKKMNGFKKENSELGVEIDSIIKENTKNELNNVEKAIEQYNRRMDKVLKSDAIKEKLDKKYQCEEKITDLMNNVQKALRKAIREINNQDINDTEKREKIMVLHNAVEDAILSDNEKNILKVLKNNITNTLDFKTLRV